MRPKAAQIHERPFRAAKDHVQPLAAQDSFLPNGKKIGDFIAISSMCLTTSSTTRVYNEITGFGWPNKNLSPLAIISGAGGQGINFQLCH